MCVRARLHVCAYVRMCVRACVRAFLCARVRFYMRVCVGAWVRVCVCVCTGKPLENESATLEDLGVVRYVTDM